MTTETESTASDPIIMLGVVIEQLEEALAIARDLDGRAFSDNRKNSPNNRALSSRLLYLADCLTLSASQVKVEYWEGKQ